MNIRPSEKFQKARLERLVTDLGVVVCSFPDGFVQRSSVEPNGSFDRGAQWKTLEMHGLFVETLRHAKIRKPVNLIGDIFMGKAGGAVCHVVVSCIHQI